MRHPLYEKWSSHLQNSAIAIGENNFDRVLQWSGKYGCGIFTWNLAEEGELNPPITGSIPHLAVSC